MRLIVDRIRGTSARDALRAAVFIAVGLALVLALATRAAAGPDDTSARLVGRPAPSFALPAEQGARLLSTPVRLASAPGHPVVLIFFFTLCPHCLNEVRALHDLAADPALASAQFLYVDAPAERLNIADAYVARAGITAPVLLDDGGAVAARYDVHYYPTVVLLDGGGIVRFVWTGETAASVIRAGIVALAPAGAQKG